MTNQEKKKQLNTTLGIIVATVFLTTIALIGEWGTEEIATSAFIASMCTLIAIRILDRY